MTLIEQFSEEEAIRITIENGYDGAEFETSVWQKRGCLKPNRTLDALISKLQTIYDHVEVQGTGKKRVYILSNKKDEITQRKFNYKGTVASLEDDVMKEYIFNCLLQLNKREYTQSYSGWAALFRFPQIKTLSYEELIKEIKLLHHGFPVIYNPKEVVSKFIQTIITRNKDVIEKSFKRLKSEGRIELSEVHNFRTIDDEFEEVDQSDYETVQKELSEFIESKGITFYTYSQAMTSLHRSAKMKEIIREVSDYLEGHFGIQYAFKSFRVKVLDRTLHKEVKRDEFKQAYFQRLIKLSKDRQDKKEYKESIIFWKKFYLLNTLSLLKHLKIEGVGEMLRVEKLLYSEKINEFTLDRMVHHFESDMEKEERRHTFGKI